MATELENVVAVRILTWYSLDGLDVVYHYRKRSENNLKEACKIWARYFN